VPPLSLNSYLFSLEECLWKEAKVTGPIPAPRTYHSSSSFFVERDELIVYSGGSEGVTPVADQKMYVFNQSEFWDRRG
jgi:hypothetical protein